MQNKQTFVQIGRSVINSSKISYIKISDDCLLVTIKVDGNSANSTIKEKFDNPQSCKQAYNKLLNTFGINYNDSSGFGQYNNKNNNSSGFGWNSTQNNAFTSKSFNMNYNNNDNDNDNDSDHGNNKQKPFSFSFNNPTKPYKSQNSFGQHAFNNSISKR